MNIQKLKREKGHLYAKAYMTYQDMKSRCSNKGLKYYPRYGGRGIELKISRENFIAWYLEEAKGQLNLTIDRIDNDGHYELGNIQLITQSENTKKAWQQSPKLHQDAVAQNSLKGVAARSRPVWIGDKRYPSLTKAAKALDVSPATIHKYLRKGRMPSGLEAGYI